MLRGCLKAVLPTPVAQALGRIYRMVIPPYARLTGPRVEWVETATGRYCLPRDAPHDYIIRAIRAGGIFEETVLRLIEDHVGPGATVLDIGAHLGQMSVLLSRRVGPTGRIYAVEANPFIFDLLERNLAANHCANAQAIFGAAHRSAGETVSFPAPRFCRHASYGSYGIDPTGRAGARIPSIAIDDLAIPGRVDFIKIDAQGCDLFALEGARRLIARDAMPILLEYEPEHDRRFGVTFADYQRVIHAMDYRIAARIGPNILIRKCDRVRD